MELFCISQELSQKYVDLDRRSRINMYDNNISNLNKDKDLILQKAHDLFLQIDNIYHEVNKIDNDIKSFIELKKDMLSF
jgi:hypothetical protein